MLRLDRNTDNSYLISIAFLEECRGIGYGTATLKAVRKQNKGKTLMAEIHKDNEVSQRLFENAGYEQVMTNGSFILYRNSK